MRTWLLATAAVITLWLLGAASDSLGMGARVAYGQTVPAAPQQVSTTAGTTQKRRPQLAVHPVTQGVYLVWEEGVLGTNNGNLFVAYRNPGTGSWSAPKLIVNPATANYGPRWGAVAGTLVNETHAHIQADSAGNLHVVYSGWRNNVVGLGAYYTVGEASDPTNLSFSTPVRLDMVSYAPATDGYLTHQDGTRIFVKDDPVLAGVKVGYVLWTGNNGTDLRLTRVQYGPAHGPVATMDAAPLTNPVDTNAGPVAVLEIDNDTLQLVYAGTNVDSGNGFWGSPLRLNGGGAAAPTWGTPAERAALAGVNGADCSVNGCTGASAVRDDAGHTWVAANFDVGTVHAIQATMHDGTPGTQPVAVSTLEDTPKAGRQPVVVYDTTAPATRALVLYNQCTYVSTSSCTGKDMYYRVHDGTTWGAANLTGNTTGEQQDLTAVMVADDLLYAWVGVNQAGTGTGQQVYFHGVLGP